MWIENLACIKSGAFILVKKSEQVWISADEFLEVPVYGLSNKPAETAGEVMLLDQRP